MKLLFCFLAVLCGAAEAGAPKYSPVNGALAAPLSIDNSYFRTPQTTAYDYWNLSSFYVPQYNDHACSAASVTMALNALLNANRARGDADENITQPGLLKKVGPGWKGLTSDVPRKERHGVTLAQLGGLSREAMAAYGVVGASVTVTMAASGDAGTLEAFRRALISNERDPDDIILLHFAQDLLTGAPGGPYAHVSPVGAYDEKSRRVLIFDVDRQWYEPYWADDAQLLKAMTLKTRRFGRGGYVVIRSGK